MAVKEGSKAAGFKMCPDMPFITRDPRNPQNYIKNMREEQEYIDTSRYWQAWNFANDTTVILTNTSTNTSYMQQMDRKLNETMLFIYCRLVYGYSKATVNSNGGVPGSCACHPGCERMIIDWDLGG